MQTRDEYAKELGFSDYKSLEGRVGEVKENWKTNPNAELNPELDNVEIWSEDTGEID